MRWGIEHSMPPSCNRVRVVTRTFAGADVGTDVCAESADLEGGSDGGEEEERRPRLLLQGGGVTRTILEA